MHAKDEMHKVVEDILSAPDYYHVLGVQQNANDEEIKIAYKNRCRICHPDRFVPANPRATESFQILSVAYETLNDPVKRQMYDVLSTTGRVPTTCFHQHEGNPEDAGAIFRTIINDLREGEFRSMRALIDAFNTTFPTMQISDDVVKQIEADFKSMHTALESTKQCYRVTKKCYKVLHSELLALYEMQQQLNSLSYFNIWRRTQLSASICIGLLQLPLTLYSTAQK